MRKEEREMVKGKAEEGGNGYRLVDRMVVWVGTERA